MTSADEIARLVAAGRLAFPGFALRSVARTRSTQDIVRAAARGGAAAGFCCIAAEQSAGRGRQGRTWSAPAGSALLCSTLVRLEPRAAGGVPLAAGLAVRAALAAATEAPLRLKWPNDVIAEGRKLAGILCEAEPLAPGPDVAIAVGVGVNIRAHAAPAGVAATSIEELAGDIPSAAHLLAELLSQLAAWLRRLASGGVPALRDAWLVHATGIGEAVVAQGPAGAVAGTAETIDDDGALLIRTAHGLTRVLGGDVHLVPRSD